MQPYVPLTRCKTYNAPNREKILARHSLHTKKETHYPWRRDTKVTEVIKVKKFRKRLLALVLTLALCTALMLPGAAAIADEADDMDVQHIYAENIVAFSSCPGNAAGHVVNHYDQSTFFYQGGERTLAYHDLYRCRVFYCVYCNTYGHKTVLETRRESHQVPCGTCGYRPFMIPSPFSQIAL